MRTVGYLVQLPGGEQGEKGEFYDYILAGNGAFIRNAGVLMMAQVPIAACQVRGLANLEPLVLLAHGKVPAGLFGLALNAALVQKEKEVYFAVTWPNDGKYHLFMQDRGGEPGKVDYRVQDNTVLEIHSHGRLAADFSLQDNRDEQGFKLSCVIGNLDTAPTVRVRIGVYGYFYILKWGDVFEGTLTGAREPSVEDRPEEVSIELQGEGCHTQVNSGRRWWDRFLGFGRTVPANDWKKRPDHSD